MKKYIKEIVITVLQILLFYLLPLFAGPTDTMGMVVLLILSTFILSLILGVISKNKIKILYPLIIAILFIPSVFIYYNKTALIHSVWYLVVACTGMLIGSLIGKFVK